MVTTARIAALALAKALEESLAFQRAGADQPEGSETLEFSVTLVREIIQALRGE